MEINTSILMDSYDLNSHTMAVLSFQGGALSADVIVVVMTMKGGTVKIKNPTTITPMKNITMIGMMRMVRKWLGNGIVFKFDNNSIHIYIINIHIYK
jgi:hypothetical protein